MAVEVFSDQPSTTVSSGGTTAPAAGTSESWTVSSSSSFPAASNSTTPPTQFHVVDAFSGKQSEIIAVTNISGSTWTVTRGVEGTTPVAHTAGFTVVQVATSGWLNTVTGQNFGYPYQFYPGNYGAKGDGQIITDGVMSTGGTDLTTGGLSAPSAPSISNSGSGGSVPAGTYTAKVTYVNAYGETVASSASSSTTTSGSTSVITVTGPASSGNATGWYVYVSNGGSYFRQQSTPTAIGLNLTLTTFTGSGTTPPGGNTTPSTPFTSADVGKIIQVKGAGASGVTTLVTTIATFVSSSHVTTTAANASGGNVAGALVLWATDDTAAFTSTVTAAQAYAVAHGYAQVYIPSAPAGLYYGIGGALVTTNYTNAQIPLTPVPVSLPAPVLEFRGQACGTTTFWHQAYPQVQGATLVSFGTFSGQTAQGNNINSFGDSCVIGGPSWNGYGGLVNGDAVYSNMHVRFANLNIITTHSASGWTYGAVNLCGVAKCSTENFSYSTTGLFLNGIGSGDFNAPGNFANGWSKGFITPLPGNNDLNDHRNLTCYGGYTWGLLATEHFDGHGIRILYCWSALCPVGTYSGAASVTGVGATHKMRWSMCSIEGCTNEIYIFGAGSAGIGPFLEGTIDTESAVPTFTDNGGGGMADALGRVTLTGLYTVGNITVPATGLEVINGQQAPGPVSLSLTINTAAQNTFWRWLTVTLAGGTGVTSVQVGNTMGGTVAPSLTTIYSQSAGVLPVTTVRVPPGGWIKVNGSTIPVVAAVAD